MSAPIFREIAQQILEEMKVPIDASVRQETQIAKNEITELPSETTKSKPTSDKPEKGAMTKMAEPATEKAKPKDVKKPTEKKYDAKGKLTAILKRRLQLTGNADIET